MRVKPVQLKKSNELVKDYVNLDHTILSYFDYEPFNVDKARLNDLKKRTFQREKLVNVLHTMNRYWGASDETLRQIERLEDKNSVVVIGGQQAGLLTGPLYTLNKIISLLILAKNKEDELNVPVIPVFWIAGEDHDYDEINHIHAKRSNHQKLYKHKSPQQLFLKQSITSVQIDHGKMTEWIQQAFHDLQETTYTKDLYETITTCLKNAETYVDFFARLIFAIFPTEGLVLFDSGNPEIRQMERDVFKQLITNQQKISEAVYETVQVLHQKGYDLSLEVEKDDAHLFYHDENNERILLKRDDDRWIGKNEEVELSTEQLLHFAENHPEKLSNNVVTRPIMQEVLFPTLAFVGGDGEISYWSALKKAFRAFDSNLKMPPVLPRLSFTYVTNRIEKLLKETVLDPKYVLDHGVDTVRMNWLLSQQSPPIETLFNETKQQMEQIHLPLRQLAQSVSTDLEEEAQKNLRFIQKHLAHLQQKTEKKLAEKYEQKLAHYDEIGISLKPNQLLQERVWSPLPFFNEYGIDFLHELLEVQSISFNSNHYLVYLD